VKRALVLLFSLAGCLGPQAQPVPGSSRPAPYSCLLPTERRMLVAELFFDRDIDRREPLTDAEWAAFVAEAITPNFPDGFTVLDGEGRWRNPRTGRTGGGRTKILLVAAKRTADLARRLTAVIDAYKREFRQHSVGLITRDSCASFSGPL
jgi:Protein of unknown function (DUF3574)